MGQNTKKEMQSPNMIVVQEVKEQKYFYHIVGAHTHCMTGTSVNKALDSIS